MSTENEFEDPAMSEEGAKMERHTPKKREFGFVVEQTVNKWTPRAEIEESINNFFDVMKGEISRRCHVKKASIVTNTHYDGRRKVLQGACLVPKEINEDIIDHLYYIAKTTWRSQPSEPYDFFMV